MCMIRSIWVFSIIYLSGLSLVLSGDLGHLLVLFLEISGLSKLLSNQIN